MKVLIEHDGNGTFDGKFSENASIKIGCNSEKNLLPTPMQLVMLAVGTCSAIDVVTILRKKKQNFSNYRIEVSGERRSQHPRSFSKIHIHHIITGKNLTEKSVADAIELSDKKYCSVAATLRPTVEISTSYEIINQE